METEAEGEEDADDDPCDIGGDANAPGGSHVRAAGNSRLAGGPFQQQVDGSGGGGLADSNGDGNGHATPAAAVTSGTGRADEDYYGGGDAMEAGQRWVQSSCIHCRTLF